MNLFQRYLADEFAEDYEEGRISRRDALKLIASVTGSLVVANSILAACAPPPEATETTLPSPTDSTATEPLATDSPTAESVATEVPSAAPYGTVMPDDPAIIASDIQFPAPDGTLMGWISGPASRRGPRAGHIGVPRKPRTYSAHPGCDASICKSGVRCPCRGSAFSPGRQRGSG